MNKKEKLTLIEGKYIHEEAQEILMNVFYSKINFHVLKNFSMQERFGKADEISLKRVPELRQNIEKIKEIIEEAQTNNKKLKITSTINIELVKNS